MTATAAQTICRHPAERMGELWGFVGQYLHPTASSSHCIFIPLHPYPTASFHHMPISLHPHPSTSSHHNHIPLFLSHELLIPLHHLNMTPIHCIPILRHLQPTASSPPHLHPTKPPSNCFTPPCSHPIPSSSHFQLLSHHYPC